ncbi:restriction endonuclease subunit S [Parasegetibacter sp. NRK P23]|uniref:restriction endonuclease subunit S n=1 Tax=Parasegetibacter sp. NRK P23 TaxID=2942999 RepID=UPI002043A21F|nr:restriction endonuclease subunit S [Parasegetibacter sp. NRK P23]MCM5527233.1 restriction endonuclease subunit S [Parasegetibacter sp. NRK P23]
MSSNEWRQLVLEDSLDALIDYRGKTPKKVEKGIPLVTAKIVKNGFIEAPNEFIAEEDYNEWMTRGLPKIGDVVLTVEAPLGEVAQIKDENIALAQRIITLRGKTGVLDSGYLKYFLQSSVGQRRLKERETGTTVTGIKQSELRKLIIDCPEYSIQKKISFILLSLDDKIENNLATNQTLEEIARTLFKEWFVNFNYPGSDWNLKQSEFGDIPVSWEVGTLGDVLEIKYGKDHKHLEEGIIPVFGSGGIMRYVNKPLYEKESILIPRKGTLSNLFYVNTPFWSVDTMFYTRINLPKSGKYLFHLLQTLNLASMNVGTAVPSLTTEILNNIVIPIPPNEVLNSFETFTTSLFVKIQDNLKENKILSAIRDSLLPQLMSGKIKL